MSAPASCRTEVPRVDDFELDGTGTHAAWNRAPWLTLAPVGERAAKTPAWTTRAKLLWSARGLYLLGDFEDRRLSCTLTADDGPLYTEDIFEAFFWPCEKHPVYFEYEISPLGYQLPLLVANAEGPFHGWLPFAATGGRAIRRASAVRGGAKAPGAAISGWSAEAFIPFALLTGLFNQQPVAGMVWRANLYRIDYDTGEAIQWAWCPATGGNFHDYRNFGTIVFAG